MLVYCFIVYGTPRLGYNLIALHTLSDTSIHILTIYCIMYCLYRLGQ